MKIKSYSELIQLPTFEERFEYLKLEGAVGKSTFGYDRYLNQALYQSYEWRQFRKKIILRDGGCDLGCDGFDIFKGGILHHINPISKEDIINRRPIVFDPDNIILTTHNTHNAIHYGDKDLLILAPTVRTKNDTCPWKL